MRNGVHFGLFLSAVTSQGTREQQVRDSAAHDVVPCFRFTPCATAASQKPAPLLLLLLLLLLLQDEWVSAGMALSIFGCFAMTELRGGSFVRGIETVRD